LDASIAGRKMLAALGGEHRAELFYAGANVFPCLHANLADRLKLFFA